MDENPTPPKRRRKGTLPAWVVLLAFLLLAGAAAGLWYLANQPKNDIRMEQMESEARDQLPIGSSKADVLAWFAARGITDYGDLTDTGGRKIGYRALIENDTWMEKAEIEIACRFDRDGKLNQIDFTRFQRY